MKWISIEEQLPEVNKNVLLFCKLEGTVIGFLSNINRFYLLYINILSENVTHWMPLPEPPKM